MAKEIKIIEKITEVLNGSAKEAITHYSDWYFFDAISSIIFGVIITSIAIMLMIKNRYENSDFEVLITILLGLSAFLGLLIITHHVPNLTAPEGKAIHLLIKDIRG